MLGVTVVLGEMDVARVKPLWLLEVAYQGTDRLGRIPPVSGGHQLPGAARARLIPGGPPLPGPGYTGRWGWGMTFGEYIQKTSRM